MTQAAFDDQLPLAADQLEAAGEQFSNTASVWRDPSQTGWFAYDSDIAACLSPLLRALGVNFNEAQIFEALPTSPKTSISTGCAIPWRTFSSRATCVEIKLADLDAARSCRCFILPERWARRWWCCSSPVTKRWCSTARQARTAVSRRPVSDGEAYFLPPPRGKTEVANRSTYRDWFPALVSRFRPIITLGLVLTLMINVISLAIPLFVMAIYDSVGRHRIRYPCCCTFPLAPCLRNRLRFHTAQATHPCHLLLRRARGQSRRQRGVSPHPLSAAGLYRARNHQLAGRPHQGLRRHSRFRHRAARADAVRIYRLLSFFLARSRCWPVRSCSFPSR